MIASCRGRGRACQRIARRIATNCAAAHRREHVERLHVSEELGLKLRGEPEEGGLDVAAGRCLDAAGGGGGEQRVLRGDQVGEAGLAAVGVERRARRRHRGVELGLGGEGGHERLQVEDPGAHDDLVVDVGDVHHVQHVVAEVLAQHAPQDVERDVVARVPDVRVVVHGRPADVPLDRAVGAVRHERLDLLRQRVEQPQPRRRPGRREEGVGPRRRRRRAPRVERAHERPAQERGRRAEQRRVRAAHQDDERGEEAALPPATTHSVLSFCARRSSRG